MPQSDPKPASDGGRAPTPFADIRRVEAVVNAASGSVGPAAAAELEAILTGYDFQFHIAAPSPDGIVDAVTAAVAADPDLLIVLAGDGTAGLAAKLAGEDGPLIAPLPGGTMNMLPHALYGAISWQAALRSALEEGGVRPVSGGQVGEHRFYVAAIFGAPALLALVREALRAHRLRRAWRHARYVFLRAFGGRLRYSLGGEPTRKGEALIVMCPMVSRKMDADGPLEAAAMSPRGAGEVLRMGVHAVLSDWREDPSVQVRPCREAAVWVHGSMPAVLDGEPMRFRGRQTVRFVPVAFRALAPGDASPPPISQTAMDMPGALAARPAR